MADELNGAPVESQVPDPVQTQVQEAAPPSFRERFEQAGYNVADYDDDKLFEALEHGLQRARRADELEPLVSQTQRYRDHASEIDKFLEEQEQARQPAKEEKPNRWKAPVENYDANWEQYTAYEPKLKRWVLTDEAKQNYISSALADNVTKQKLWERANAEHITRNFPDAVKEAVADILSEMEGKFDQRLTGYTQQMREAAFAQNYLKQHAKDLYQHTDKGPVLDASGQMAPSQQGQAFDHFVNKAREIGISKVEEVISYAEAMTGQYMDQVAKQEAARKKVEKKEVAAEAEVAKTPEQRNEEAKQSFVRRNIRGSRMANLATPSADADASALKERRGSPKPNFHEIRKALAEAQN